MILPSIHSEHFQSYRKRHRSAWNNHTLLALTSDVPLVSHSYPNYAAQSLCSSTWPSYLCFVDQTKPPSFAALLKRLPWHGRAHRAKRRMEQVQVQLALSCPSRNDDLFYYLLVCPVTIFKYVSTAFFVGASRLSVQLTDSPVVES